MAWMTSTYKIQLKQIRAHATQYKSFSFLVNCPVQQCIKEKLYSVGGDIYFLSDIGNVEIMGA